MEFLAGFVNKLNQIDALLLVLLLGWLLGFGWFNVSANDSIDYTKRPLYLLSHYLRAFPQSVQHKVTFPKILVWHEIIIE